MANIKISQLPSASGLAGTELLEMDQAGTSVSSTVNNILTARLAAIPLFIAATGAYNANIYDSIVADTSTSAFTITLPASPNFGNIIWFIDGAGTWNTNNLTISGNGNKILSNVGNLIVTTARDNFSLVFYNSVQGWIIGD